jgi:arthrofactin-type cyclic lipopeptide synthetase B
VKIRGFRIELGEIEAKLCATGAVREAVVVAREQSAGHWSRGSGDVPSGEKQLVAYVIAAEGVQIQVGELREQLSRELAEYMIPSAFVQLQAWPRTPNGKLDRKALPVPDETAYQSQEYEAPQGEVEQALAGIWSELLLQRERIGRHDNFFAIGGHSVMAVSVIERMQRSGFKLRVSDLFTLGTLAELARAVELVEPQFVPVPPAVAASEEISEEIVL